MLNRIVCTAKGINVKTMHVRIKFAVYRHGMNIYIDKYRQMQV